MSSADPAPAATAPWPRFRRGMTLGLPIFLGYMPLGAAFGMLARAAGFSVLQVAVCSATVLAGAGQFIAAALVNGSAAVVAVLVATAVVNLRYVLFATTIAPSLRDTRVPMQLGLAFTLTDETFGVNTTDISAGTADDWSMLGVGFISWLGWTLGSTIGAAGAGFIGDPSKWGADFAMAAMFTALLVAQAEEHKHIVVAVVAAMLALAFSAVLPGKWYIVAASMLAAAVGAALWPERLATPADVEEPGP